MPDHPRDPSPPLRSIDRRMSHPPSTPDRSLDGRIDLLLRLADRAGAIALEHFQSPALRVERKEDASPVTVADHAIEAMLRAGIRAECPGDAILGEEHGDEPGATGWRWIIDPIDGTISFAAGVPMFGTLIAIEREGEICGGLCAMPALGERVWAARGRGAWWERRRAGGTVDRSPAQVRSCGSVSQALLCVSGLEYFRRSAATGVLRRVVDAAAHVRSWSDCYGGILLATGRVDGWVDPLMHPWDLAPFPLIVAEAGGVCTDWTGRADIGGGNAVGGSASMHAQLMALIDLPAGRGER